MVERGLSMKQSMIVLMLLFMVAQVRAQAPLDTLIFSHKLHSEGGAECSVCHATADSSRSPLDNLLPDMESCYQCHDREAACTLCHTNPDEAGQYGRVSKYIARFPHSRHVSAKTTCSSCHQGIENKEKVGSHHLPKMAACSKCHDDLDKPDYCYDCHIKSENLQPANHKTAWREGHGLVKLAGEDNCKACHSEQQCLHCHQSQNLDRQVHPPNFRFSHGIQSRANRETCYTCHQDRQSCIDCHRAEMVMPRTHASAGWANRSNGGLHRRAAAMDLDGCMACHSEAAGDPVCAQCHQAR
jgi:hypothetical protein